ncbi:MAG: hypothetical protein JO336_24875, partial [Acidobacteriia bacterium]|nr:hypothetical protein [Terriglobia bacterium]
MGRAGEAMLALARHAGFPCHPAGFPEPPGPIADREMCAAWIESCASSIGLHLRDQILSYAAIPQLGHSGPALVQFRADGEIRLLAVKSTRKGDLLVLAPDYKIVRIAATALRSAIAGPLEE